MKTYLNLSFYLTFLVLLDNVKIGYNLPTSPKCNSTRPENVKWTKDIFPNPQINVNKCGRYCKKSWVCDPNHVLSKTEGDKFDSLILSVQTSGKCDCSRCTEKEGFHIGLAVVKSMTSRLTKSLIKESVNLWRLKWYSNQTCGNNILVVVSTADKIIYTSVGNSSNKYLTNECIDVVNGQIQPLVDDGKYYNAIYTLLKNYKYILAEGNCDYFSWKQKLSLISYILGGVFGGTVSIVAIVTVIRTLIMSKRLKEKEVAMEATKDLNRIQQLYRNSSYDSDKNSK